MRDESPVLMLGQIARSRSMLQAENAFLWLELLDTAASAHNLQFGMPAIYGSVINAVDSE